MNLEPIFHPDTTIVYWYCNYNLNQIIKNCINHLNTSGYVTCGIISKLVFHIILESINKTYLSVIFEVKNRNLIVIYYWRGIKLDYQIVIRDIIIR